MTGPDQGDDGKGFLARWSQRKQEAKQPEPKPDAPASEADVPSVPVAEVDAAQQFDLASLPRLEDMTGTTDITGFLRKGVPEQLRNAALRKSWTLDPAIRNYVNPALDYAYDWNTPGGVPGSSEIGAGTDVARLVLQIMGGGEKAVEPSVSAVDPPDEQKRDLQQHQELEATQEPKLRSQAVRRRDDEITMGEGASNAEKAGRIEGDQVAETERHNPVAPQQAVRRHGSAKPLV
jgi:hypothetical protein